MNKWGSRLAFFITCSALLITSYATQANSLLALTWLPLLSANLQSLQLDKHCPQNQLHDLQVTKNTSQIMAKVKRIAWDLDCVGDPSSQASDNTPLIKESAIKQLLQQWLAAPYFELQLQHINLKSKQLNRPFITPLTIHNESDGLHLKMSNKLANAEMFLHRQSQQLSLDVTMDAEQLQHYVNIDAAYQPWMSGELTLQYRADMTHWQKGEFRLAWQPADGAHLKQGNVLLVGRLDLSAQQIVLTQALMESEQINLPVGEQQRWLGNAVSLRNNNALIFNYAPFKVERADISVNVAPSQLLTKRQRVEQQKLPPLLLQLDMHSQGKQLAIDWQAQLLSQLLQGSLQVEGPQLSLQMQQQHLDIKLLVSALSQYVKDLDRLVVESGEGKLSLSADYDYRQQTFGIDSKLTTTQISGQKEALLFDGVSVNSRLHYSIDAHKVITIHKDKQQLKIENLFVGIPIQALQVDARVAAFNPVIDHFKARVLGGRVDFEQFSTVMPSTTNVKLSSISLSEIFKYSVYPEIQAQGFIDGSLPLTVSKEGVQIESGNIFAREPGGYIKVPENTVIKAMGRGNPAFSLTMQLLANFQFDTLQGKLDYENDGETELKIEVKGMSPTVSATQPINLNYSHSENILKLLKSLRFKEQLERDIEERY